MNRNSQWKTAKEKQPKFHNTTAEGNEDDTTNNQRAKMKYLRSVN
jgi:hypothetical protein